MKKIIETITEMQAKMPVGTIILVLVVAFIVALIIYMTYKMTYSGVMYNPRFNLSLVMITMVTTIVMIVIGSNISVSLGMVGALSIVRFRTAIKDPRDTAFIFWSVVSGLACGTQNYLVVLIGSLAVCLILFGFRMITGKSDKYLLIIKGRNFDVQGLEDFLNQSLKSYMCNGKYVRDDGIELIYDVKLKHNNDDFIYLIKRNPNITAVNLVASNTDTMG